MTDCAGSDGEVGVTPAWPADRLIKMRGQAGLLRPERNRGCKRKHRLLHSEFVFGAGSAQPLIERYRRNQNPLAPLKQSPDRRRGMLVSRQTID